MFTDSPELHSPDDIFQYLNQSYERNKYEVVDWKGWIARPLTRMGKCVVLAPGKIQYTTRILGVIEKTSDEPSLFTAEFKPEPPQEFWGKKAAVLINHAFVQTGHVIVTQFRANVRREMNFEGEGGVELVEVYKPKVLLKTYFFPVPHGDELKLEIKIGESRLSTIPLEVSIDGFRFEANLPNVTSKHSVNTDFARITLPGEDEGVTFSASVRASENKAFEMRVAEFPESFKEQFSNYLDKIWLDRSILEYKREEDSKKRALNDFTRAYMKSLHKTHFFLLSNNLKWEEKLSRYGVVRVVDDLDIPYICEQLEDDRCDILVADTDFLDDLYGELIEKLTNSRTLQRIPLMWIQRESARSDVMKQHFLTKGAYDIISTDISTEKLDQKMVWMGRETEIGEGETLVIISPSAKNQYRLGQALYREGMKIVKSMSLDNPISTLNKVTPRWILIDGVSIGKGFDMILVPCLKWALRANPHCDVVLIASLIDPEKVVDWLSDGLKDIVSLDPRIEDIAEKTLERIWNVFDV